MSYRWENDGLRPYPDRYEHWLRDCETCGYPEPFDWGPVEVRPLGEDEWLGGYHLLACPNCGLTFYTAVER